MRSGFEHRVETVPPRMLAPRQSSVDIPVYSTVLVKSLMGLRIDLHLIQNKKLKSYVQILNQAELVARSLYGDGNVRRCRAEKNVRDSLLAVRDNDGSSSTSRVVDEERSRAVGIGSPVYSCSRQVLLIFLSL